MFSLKLVSPDGDKLKINDGRTRDSQVSMMFPQLRSRISADSYFDSTLRYNSSFQLNTLIVLDYEELSF